MDKRIVVLRLELLAAKATQLAADLENGGLQEGDLTDGLSELRKQLQSAEKEAR